MSTAALETSSVILLTDDYAKSNMARSVPGAYWNPDEKFHVLDADAVTPRAAAVAIKLFPHLAIEYPVLESIRDSMIQDVRPFDNATPAGMHIEAPANVEWMAQEGKTFYEFQDLDLGYVSEVLRQHGGAYIGWERGLGKTIGATSIIEELGAQQVLIVAPNTAKSTVWEPECVKFEDFDYRVEVLPNVKTKRERLLTRLKEWKANGESVILIVHYEALDLIAKQRKDGRGWDQYGEWDMVIADEAHRIKNPKAKMTRALKKIPTRYKLALSGSIIQNHAEELFSPLQWLFPERYRSKWRDWNDRFLDYVDSGYSQVFVGIKLDRLEEMREELGVFMTYRRKEDELDLPAKIEQDLYVELSPGQRKAYEELVTTCLTELEDGSTVKAADGLVMLTKLRQLATGLDLVGDLKDSSKLDVAIDLIEDNEDEAFVVFSWFKAANRSLQERLEARGIETFLVDGDVPHERRATMIEEFQAGEGRVFLGTISTLGESVNLQRANNVITLDRAWNPALNVQAVDRCYRIGQTKPVTVAHLIAKGTVDEHRVQPTIVNKEALRSLILGR